MTKPSNGTVPFDASDLARLNKNYKKKSILELRLLVPPPPPSPFRRKRWSEWGGRKRAQLPGLADQPSDSFRSVHTARTLYLIAHDAEVLICSRLGLFRKEKLRAGPSEHQTKYTLSRSRVQSNLLVSANKPRFVRFSVSGGRDVVCVKHYISFELHCHCRLLSRGRERFPP